MCVLANELLGQLGPRELQETALPSSQELLQMEVHTKESKDKMEQAGLSSV